MRWKQVREVYLQMSLLSCPRNISQLKCLLDAISVEYEKVMIPESVAFDPEYEKKKIVERQLSLNEKRKRLGLDVFLWHITFFISVHIKLVRSI